MTMVYAAFLGAVAGAASVALEVLRVRAERRRWREPEVAAFGRVVGGDPS